MYVQFYMPVEKRSFFVKEKEQRNKINHRNKLQKANFNKE